MTTATDGSVALEIERLRGTVGTGIAEIKGELGVIKSQGDRAAEDIKVERDARGRLETRLAAVERKVVFASGIASALGAGGGFLAAVFTR